MKIVIFTTCSMPGILAMQDFVEKNPEKIAAIVVLPSIPKTWATSKKRLFASLGRIPLPVLFYKLMETWVYYSLRRLLGRETPFSIAKKHGIPAKRIDDPNTEAFRNELVQLNCDLIFNISPTLLRGPLLQIPRLGCVNFHGAVLPDWGGVANYFWVLIHDLPETGTTAHFMTEKVDAGDIVEIKRFPITPSDSVHSVNAKNNRLCNVLMQDIAVAVDRGPLPRHPTPPGTSRSFPTRADIAGLRKKRKLFTIKDFRDSLLTSTGSDLSSKDTQAIRYERLQPGRIPEVSRFHSANLVGKLTWLGTSYIRYFYQTVLTFDDVSGWVALQDEEVVGFALGCSRGTIMRRLIRSSVITWFCSSCLAALRHPLSFARVAVSTLKGLPAEIRKGRAELSYLAVKPDQQRRGIGAFLLRRFCEDLKSRGIDEFELSVMQDKAPALRFYQAIGGTAFCDFETAGLKMRRFVFKVDSVLNQGGQ